MKPGLQTTLALTALTVMLAACGGISNPTPKQLTVENHWGGNTGGKGMQPQFGGNAISNFVVDIKVLNRADLLTFPGFIQDLAPLVVTKSYWDETGMAEGAYSNGMRAGKGEIFNNPQYLGDTMVWPGAAVSYDKTTYNGITATIERPHVLDSDHELTETLTDAQIRDIKQQNAEDQGIPLTDYQDNLPYVGLSDGRTIRSVFYPTSVAFDAAGDLWVADNGPDQNFKIFKVPSSGAPTLDRTFGDQGGVFKAANGKLPGQMGDKRFWGVRGVGFSDAGEIFVGTSGIPGQGQGGTDIRAFDSAGNPTWNVKGLFMHSPDIDPSSNGRQIYTAGQRFEMDYSKLPGASWRQAATTLDPFRFPGDPRLFDPYDIAFVRVVNGQKFLFITDMAAFNLAIFRFEANSEIAIPTAFIGIGSSQQGAAWTQGKAPEWDTGDNANNKRRLMWRDANGNGAVDVGEFTEVSMPTPYTRTIDIDDNGNVWVAGRFNEHNTGNHEGGNLMIPFGTIDGKGVPFLGSVPRYVDIPSSLIPELENLNFGASRVLYLAASDTLLMARGTRQDYYSTHLYVIDGHLKNSANSRLRFKLDLGFDDQGEEDTDILSNPNKEAIAKMVLPTVFTADADYLYVGYMENGLDAHVRGEITVYSMVDGHKVGWMVPGAETNHFAGNFDMRHGIHVRKLADGTRIIVAEENGAGKFMVYRWKP